MQRATTRRRLLVAVAGLGSAAVAGCGTDDATRTDGAGDRTTETAVTSSVRPPASPTATPTATPAATTPPESTPTPTPVATSLAQRGRRFLKLLDAGEAARASDRVADRVRDQLGAGRLARIWRSLTGPLGTYEGVVATETRPAAGGTAVLLTAQFAGGRRVFRLVFEPGGSPAERGIVGLLLLEPYSEPSYVDGSVFESEDASVGDGCTPGRLSLPTGDGTVPGVVIVHGSGPSDLDGSVGTNKPYRDLALGLASRGIAVLRYDKRTLHCNIPPSEQTIDSVVVDDAVAAVDRLQESNRVGDAVVVGHSLGGAMAPRIAARSDGVAGTVQLAANARPLFEALLDQRRFAANFDGRVTDAERREIEATAAAVERIRAGEVPVDEYRLGASGAFWDSLRNYDRFETANGLSVPSAFLQGTADWKVTVTDDFERWRAELTREAVSFRTFDGLDHLFTPGERRPGERFVTENVSEAVVDAVARRVVDMADA